MALAVAKPPPEWPQMPARSMSMNGCGRRARASRDLIGDRVVAHVAVVEVEELLRAQLGAHAVDRDDDEAELGERLVVGVRG
jgi:hypothetical protein